MKNRKTALYAFVAALIVLVGLTPLVASAGSPAQGGPTATPEDPVWLAFAAARAALEEKTGQDLTFVQRWSYEEAEFVQGIDSCRTLAEDEAPHQLYFGWRFVITTLGGATYEVRTSFNYQIVSICDEVTQTAQEAAPAANADPNLPAPVAGSANMNGFELGGQVVGLYPELAPPCPPPR